MADNSLDDFFAKKDKSKKKSKSKKTDVDGDSKLAKKEKKKDKEAQNNGTGSDSGQTKPDVEEWKDFEEEKEVDYTGLRIQNLQIAKENEERDAVSEDEEEGEEGGERREGKSGPWNKKGEKGAAPAPKKKAAPAPVAPVEESPAGPKVPGKYVPPSQRNGGTPASSGTPGMFPHSRRKKEAPNVNSEVDFPTLGGGGGRWSQQPGHGDVIDNNPALRKGVSLSLENRFSSLQD